MLGKTITTAYEQFSPVARLGPIVPACQIEVGSGYFLKRGPFELISQPATAEDGVSQSSPFAFRSDDFPIVPSRHQLHLTSCSPPAIHVSRDSHPELFAC